MERGYFIMMEKPTRPAILIQQYWSGANRTLGIPIVVPDGSQVMDVYNILLGLNVQIKYHDWYGWITTKGHYISGEEAAQMALEANLLDKKVKSLTTEDYRGSWKP